MACTNQALWTTERREAKNCKASSRAMSTDRTALRNVRIDTMVLPDSVRLASYEILEALLTSATAPNLGTCSTNQLKYLATSCAQCYNHESKKRMQQLSRDSHQHQGCRRILRSLQAAHRDGMPPHVGWPERLTGQNVYVHTTT